MSDALNPNRVQLGREAEAKAAQFLIDQGYAMITRNYKAHRGEIDLVAMDGDVLVFVEVKYRQAPGYSPEESIGQQKLKALSRAILEYITEMELKDPPTRLDLIAIDRDGTRHYKDILAP